MAGDAIKKYVFEAIDNTTNVWRVTVTDMNDREKAQLFQDLSVPDIVRGELHPFQIAEFGDNDSIPPASELADHLKAPKPPKPPRKQTTRKQRR